MSTEVFISVDVETAGPIPGTFSLLSVGACRVDDISKAFSCQLKPITQNSDPKALEVVGLSLDHFEKEGLEPAQAMEQFTRWLNEIVGQDQTPVFVGLNAPFDWSFINFYFQTYTGRNPFGFSALDIKAYYMGLIGCDWSETRSSEMVKVLHPTRSGDHDPLHDAQFQAELFQRMLEDRQKLYGVRK